MRVNFNHEMGELGSACKSLFDFAQVNINHESDEHAFVRKPLY